MITAFELGMQKAAVMAPRRDPAEMPESIQRIFESFGVRAPKVPIMYAGGSGAGTSMMGTGILSLPKAERTMPDFSKGFAKNLQLPANPVAAGIGYAPPQTELAGWK